MSDNASQPESTASDSTQPYPDLGSPEGREGFAKHYDSVVGSTTMLVSSHADADAIAMAHHGSVSKDRRKQIEEQLKRGQLRCVVATSSLELGIDMGSVDLVIQIAPPLSVSSGLQRVGAPTTRSGESRMHCSTRLHESKSSARPQTSNACAPETSKH